MSTETIGRALWRLTGLETAAAAGVAAVGFELLPASAVRPGAHAPEGQLGHLALTDAQSFEVEFAAGCRVRADLVARGQNLAVCRLTLLACSLDEPFLILLRVRLANRTPPYFMIPGVLYGTNAARRGPMNDDPAAFGPDVWGGDPKLDYRAGQVDHVRRGAPAWHVRADRSSALSASANFDGHFVALGIREATLPPAGDDWVYNSLGVWTDAARGDSLSVAMGSLDWPARIIRFQLQDAPALEPLPARAAAGWSTEFCVYAGPARDRFAYEPFLAAWNEHLHEPPRAGAPLGQAVRDVAGALITDGMDPRTGYFHMLRDASGIVPAPIPLAWCGTLQLARPLLQAGNIFDEPRYVQVATDVIERATREALNPASGFFFDMFADGRWQGNRWWPELGHSSAVNGHACHILLRLYEDDPGRTAWAERARQVLGRVLPHQWPDGRFPSGFALQDGAPATDVGYGGCFWVAPLLMLERLFGDRAAGAAGRKALERYWEEFATLDWVGVNFDTRGAVDSSAGYSLARALAELHRQRGAPRDLERLGHVLHYGCSYHLGHNTRHRHPACAWSSSGSKITSTHNVHLDAEAGEIMAELGYYAARTGDRYFRQRLADATAWARQAYNRTEAEYGWGKVGWCTEQYYHTYDRYGFGMQPPLEHGDGTIWEAYFPWAAGALLNAFVAEAQGEPKP